MLPVPPLRTRTKSKIQMRTHMGEMSYKCSQCNYTCTRVTNLHTHMLTHTEVRPVNCDQCIKTRLTYNCAHLRSTKESLIFEYFDIYFL